MRYTSKPSFLFYALKAFSSDSLLLFPCLILQNVRLAKIALRPGAGDLVNGILRKLVSLKVSLSFFIPFVKLLLFARELNTKEKAYNES